MIAGALDLTLVLFWISLGVSAAVVGLFLWLMREEEPREAEKPRTGTEPVAEPGSGQELRS